MADDRQGAEALVAYWDALVLARATDGFAVEEDMATALARFQDLKEVAPGGARERVWQELQPAMTGRHSFEPPRSLPVLYARPLETRDEPPAAPAAWQLDGHGLLLAHFATAALVLLTLTLGLLTLGPSRFNRIAPGKPATSIRAPNYPAASETVFAIKVPSERVPVAASLHYFVWRLSLAPGKHTLMTPQERSCCDGPRIIYVMVGHLTLRADGPMQVERGGELMPSAGVVPAGTSVLLLPGDTVMLDDAAATEFANEGADPVQLITAGISTRTAPDSRFALMEFLDGSHDNLPGPLPAGPVELSLVRTTLEPDGEFPAPPPGSGVLEVGENGDASIGKRMDGSLFNINSKAETIYVFIIEPLGISTLIP